MSSLPDPSPEERLLSARVSTLVQEAVLDAGGWLPFDRYMDLALYAPGAGYYVNGSLKFGQAGDFVTAPLLDGQMAACLARQVTEVLDSGDWVSPPVVIEFGAGDGSLARDLLACLGQADRLPDRYIIVETSAELRARQEETLAGPGSAPGSGLPVPVHWAETLPDTVDGVILANEVLDAMPVTLFCVDGDNTLLEGGVEWRQGQPDLTYRHTETARRCGGRFEGLALRPGYRGEIGLRAEAWTRTLATRLRRGMLLLLDYGFPRPEFYHPDRSAGTLMCHYRHRSHPDPFFFPGIQDITAHVDFSAIAEAGREAGLELAGFTSQGNFLLALGLLDNLAGAAAGERAVLEAAQVIKKLTLPHEMGELFKVLALGRDLDFKPAGFSLRDRSGRL